MSRGLGWLQREILATLDEAKATPLRYAGGRSMPYHGGPGRVAVRGFEVELPTSVYDLRASMQFLARRHGKTYHNILGATSVYASREVIDDCFRISFYRAARSLIRRGLLLWCNYRGEVQWAGFSMGREGRFVCLADA